MDLFKSKNDLTCPSLRRRHILHFFLAVTARFIYCLCQKELSAIRNVLTQMYTTFSRGRDRWNLLKLLQPAEDRLVLFQLTDVFHIRKCISTKLKKLHRIIYYLVLATHSQRRHNLLCKSFSSKR